MLLKVSNRNFKVTISGLLKEGDAVMYHIAKLIGTYTEITFQLKVFMT